MQGAAAPMGNDELDAKLVRKVQRGDRMAYDLLVRKYQHRIAAVVSRYVPDFGEAQDVVQETFIRAWRAIGNFRGEAQFYSWLYRIAVNTSKNFLMAQNRRPPADDVDLGDPATVTADFRLQNPDTPEHELLRQEIERVVSRSIDALPPDLRQAIVLREVDGLSYEEIAEAMECPIGTVRSRIFRAREAIDHALSPLLDKQRN